MKRQIKSTVVVHFDSNPVVADLYHLSLVSKYGFPTDRLKELKSQMIESWSWAEWRRYQAACRFKKAILGAIWLI